MAGPLDGKKAVAGDGRGIYALDLTAVCLVAQAMNIEVDGEFVSRVCAYEDESVPLLQRKEEENTCTRRNANTAAAVR
jgi:hypothetical protein